MPCKSKSGLKRPIIVQYIQLLSSMINYAMLAPLLRDLTNLGEVCQV